MDSGAQTPAEEIVRALGAAAAALRLYPPTSELPAQAVRRAAQVASAVTASGPVRFVVEPKAFKFGDDLIGENHAQVSGFAETLYAHQVGQVIIAPGLSENEITAFLQSSSSDAAAVREEGGLRSVLVAAGVTHLAVIELTLRTSTEEGLAGIDLTSAPREVIGPAIVRAAADWARTASGTEGRDQVSHAIGGLESATRELAAARIAEAMTRLDEQTRSAVLAAAVRRDATGKDMAGMLSVVAGMKPASLARLLTLAAARTGSDATTLMGRLELPPEAARALMLLLRPNPRSEAESGVPPQTDAAAIAAEAVIENEEDERSIRDQVAASAPALAAGRALGTALALARLEPTDDAIAAVGDALGPALAAGAFAQVGSALTLIASSEQGRVLELAAQRARQLLTDPEVLAQACTHIRTPFTAEAAAPVLAQSGSAGAESLLAAWTGAQGAPKHALEEVLLANVDQVLPVAGRRVRAGEPDLAVQIISLLGRLPDRRVAPVLSQALDNPSTEVRAAAIETLAQIGTDDAMRVVATALHHADEATAFRALYEVRMAGARSATPDLVAALTSPRPARSWEFKREVVDCLKELRATEAVPALKREAGHIFAFTAKRRMLRQAARDALDAIRSEPDRG